MFQGGLTYSFTRDDLQDVCCVHVFSKAVSDGGTVQVYVSNTLASDYLNRIICN